MSDSILQKQFEEGDLQRVRNLVQKKYGEGTITRVGYKKQKQEHKEGEIFEEDGKNWIIQDGIKTTFSKLDLVKKSLQVPLVCPHCSKTMKHRLDKKFYFIHKKCFDCVVNYETKLRLEGKFEDYARDLIKKNASSFICDLEQELKDFLNEGIESYITEQGDIEDWQSTTDKKKAIEKELQEYITSIKSIIGN